LSPCPHGLFLVAENATQFFSGDRIRFPSLILHLAHSCGNFSGPFRIYGDLSSAGGKLSSAAWGDLSEWHHERCGHGFMNIVSGGIVEALPNGHGCGLNGAQS
jgi:hypothetical protein